MMKIEIEKFEWLKDSNELFSLFNMREEDLTEEIIVVGRTMSVLYQYINIVPELNCAMYEANMSEYRLEQRPRVYIRL
jgi:hypothetical protein